MGKDRDPVKRTYSRPELVKFGAADRLTETIIRPVPSGFLGDFDRS